MHCPSSVLFKAKFEEMVAVGAMGLKEKTQRSKMGYALTHNT
jgi:hypothetical protein